MSKARQMVKTAKKNNKLNQEAIRIKKALTIMEDRIDKKAECWKSSEIFAFLLVLESDTKNGKKIVVRSLERKFGLVKSIFREKFHPISMEEERQVKMALTLHIQNRLDEPDEPTEDLSAPLLSPLQWKSIQQWLNDKAKITTNKFINNKHMAMLSVAIGFSTGLRLTEIHRLKYSDLNLNGKDGIKIRIRRSKSNRNGHKKVYNIAPGHEAEPLLCPVRNLLWYVENAGKTMNKGSYIFSKDREGRELANLGTIKRYWRNAAKGLGMEKDKRPKAHSHHNAKINMARALGYSEEEITDAMNWCSVSVLHQYLRKMQENKKGIAYKLTSLSAVDLTTATKHLWD